MTSLVPQQRFVRERRPPGTGRRVFVGDIQGCLAELEHLLTAIDFRIGHDALYPVGDLVNRGPASKETLRFLRSIEARPVLGNHDLHLLAVARGKRRLSPNDTLDDVLAAPDRELLLEWLAEQPLVRAHTDLYQVHAGFHPDWSNTARLERAVEPVRGQAAKAATAILTRVRFCDEEGVMPSKRVLTDRDGNPRKRKRWKPWYHFYAPGAGRAGHGGRMVVYGHWAVMGIVEREDTIGLDSGCVWGGSLTAYLPDEGTLVSVPAKRAYAGNYRPR